MQDVGRLKKMPWLPLYIDREDAGELLGILNADPEIAFIVSNGPGHWIAQDTLSLAPDGRRCLWHHLSGPLPCLPAGTVKDPWRGWKERASGADPTQPYFGAGHVGIVWWNIHTLGKGAGIGMSSFEWIGSRYRLIGFPADPSTERWWKQLRQVVKRTGALRIPRSGPLEGPGAEIWAMPGALAKIKLGVQRDENPS